ncbi:hypothetical protein ILYODFUR_036246 [Ilyodon furcidens]|uniref:Secreted protein n=1 Tax=Ilyodon furcidens TaxID=33524 RepID=A0ABV0V907_9TELE
MPDFVLSVVLLIWITDFWRKDFGYRGLRSQISVFFICIKTSWQLPVSPPSTPRHKHNLFTFQHKYFHSELLTVLHKSRKPFKRTLCVERSDSESLTPPGG